MGYSKPRKKHEMHISANSDGTEDEDLECGNEEESHILNGDEDEDENYEDDENGDTGDPRIT